MSHPDAAMFLTAFIVLLQGMPGDIDISFGIGSDGPAPIHDGGIPDQVALMVKRSGGIVHPSVEQGLFGFARAVPDHVSAPGLAEGELPAANRPRRDRALRLTVDSDWS